MDAIVISKFILFLTLLTSGQTSTSNTTATRFKGHYAKNQEKLEIEKQQKQFALLHSQLLKQETLSKLSTVQTKTRFQTNNNSLPKPLKLRNIDYDYDDWDNKTIHEVEGDDQPRRFKQKSTGSYHSRLNAALNIAAKQGLDAMVKLYEKTEPDMIRKGLFLESTHPGAQLSKFSEPFDGTENNAKAAYAALVATKYFQKTYKLQPDDLGRQAPPPKISFRRTPLEGLCPPREQPRCLPAAQRYRTHDGTCNNMKRTRWGSSLMPFNRFLPPEYADGIDTIRGSVDGGPLPSARFVSLLVHGSRDSQAPVTLMIAQWGQLIDHDLTSTAQPRSVNGSVPRCCGSDDFHPSCLPIKVPLDDPWLAPLKVRCLEFLRSAPAQRRDCVLSWREQTNQATSYLDASPVYSSSARTSDIARVFRNGLLQFGRGNPQDDVCMRGALSDSCIRAGDGRSGEQPGLLAMHHIWVGEHNRIALELSDLNPHWSDEKVYQEARRIVGALFQHISYREFLPLVVGRDVCKLFDLELMSSGYYNGYDPDINPTVANSFGAAAFRFGHSLIQGTYMRCDKNHNFLDNNVALHNEQVNGDMEGAGSLHRLIRGLAAQKAQMRDEFITAELTNHLFQSGSFPFGLDLAAINIQRGRDHGVPPYTSWREPCGLTPIESWLDLEKIVGPASTKRISHAYRSVHDIDLFVGGISERPVIGGLVGPTFACIIAQQFSNLRKGDRFWYENRGFENSFTPAQLHSIRRVSLAQVVCRTLGGGTLQPHIFIPHDMPGNERIPCGEDLLAPINLRPWLEEDPFQAQRHPPPIPPPSVFSGQSEHNIPLPPMFDNVEFVPHSSTGLQKQPVPDRQPIFNRNATNIEIDDKLDIQFPSRFTSTSPPRRVLTQKFDLKKRKPVPTSLPNKKTQDFTTRRTVIINNIPLILRRSADPFSTETIDPDAQTRSEDIDLHQTHDRTNMKDNDIIYVQINPLNSTKPYFYKNETIKARPEQRHKKEETIYETTGEQKDLRHRLDNEGYEIEINIRQTNKRRPEQYYHGDYSSKYDDRNKISTPFSYRPSYSLPTSDQTANYRPQTKPPNIIYVDDHDDQTTTSAPGLLQTFFMVGTNNIIEHLQKPAAFFQNNIFGGGPTSNSNNNLISNSNSVSSTPSHSDPSVLSSSNPATNNIFNINIRPSEQNYDFIDSPPFISPIHPASTLPPPRRPSSSRPPPTLPPPRLPSPSLPPLSHSSGSTIGSYGLHTPSRYPTPLNYDPPKNPFSTGYGTSNSFSAHSVTPQHDYDRFHYSTTTTRRPYYRPTNSYYPRLKNALQMHEKSKNITVHATDMPPEPTDYRLTTYSTILPADNFTKTTEEVDYDYLDSDLASRYDKDGYLRPEYMLLRIMGHETNESTTKNESPYRDNITLTSRDDFVLPVLMETEASIKQTKLKKTSYYDAIPRRPATEILAADYDELSKPKLRNDATKKPLNLVPFAPLNVLTKPERPDRWVIVDAPVEKDPLPDTPALDTGHASTIEYPKPIMIRIRNIAANRNSG